MHQDPRALHIIDWHESKLLYKYDVVGSIIDRLFNTNENELINI